MGQFNKCNLEPSAIHTFPIMPPPHLFNPYRVRMIMMDMRSNEYDDKSDYRYHDEYDNDNHNEYDNE